MSARLDVKKVRTALMADPAFSAGLPKNAQEAFGDLIEALPEVLKEHLDKKVALRSFIEAKLAIVEHTLESGFIGKMFAAVPEEELPMTVDEMTEMMTMMLKQLRGPFMNMIHDTQAFLENYGVTERQMLANAQGGRFSAQTLAAYDKGKLTIRSLLETQPAALLLNGEG
jgi:hypothetical protein